MKRVLPFLILPLAFFLAGCRGEVAVSGAIGQQAKGDDVFDWPNRIPSAVQGKHVYEENCAGCHGANGTTPVTARNAPVKKEEPATGHSPTVEAAPLSIATAPAPQKAVETVDFNNAAYLRPKLPRDFYLSLTDPNLMPAEHRRIDQTKLTRQDKWNAIFYIWSLATRDADSTPDKPTYETIKKAGAIFIKNCSVCHGAKGLGDGNLSHTLDPKPRNFNDFTWMFDKNSDRLFRSISEGRDWTAMPPWKETLTEEQRWQVIQYLWTFIYEHPDKQVANHSIAAE